MNQIRCIVSGGQTGVDRAALDFAIAEAIPYGGWCPKGGWAEDMPKPPGLLARYPNLRETPSSDLRERTEWNVRDSDATLVFFSGETGRSPGTQFTLDCIRKHARPFLVIDPFDPAADAAIRGWLHLNKDIRILNISGPRESEASGIYVVVLALLNCGR